jgi:hypothetical protein
MLYARRSLDKKLKAATGSKSRLVQCGASKLAGTKSGMPGPYSGSRLGLWQIGIPNWVCGGLITQKRCGQFRFWDGGAAPTTCLSGRIALPPNPSSVSEDWEFLCLPFSRAVSNGATQGQSICLILRTEKSRIKRGGWYGITS